MRSALLPARAGIFTTAHGLFRDLHVVCDTHHKTIIFYIGDGSVETSACDDLISALQLGKHFFVSFFDVCAVGQ